MTNKAGFSDGPVCTQVAVVDYDLASESVRPPVELLASASRGSEHTGTYRYAEPTDIFHALMAEEDGGERPLGEGPRDLCDHPRGRACPI